MAAAARAEQALHAAVYTQSASPIPWPVYRQKYLAEMREQKTLIDELAKRAKSGETITLLCSSACTGELRCHRSLLAELIEAAAKERGIVSG